jgi:hypothetical protein
MGQFGFFDAEKRLAARDTSTAARLYGKDVRWEVDAAGLWASGLDVRLS